MSVFNWDYILLLGFFMIVLSWSGILINNLNILFSILCIEMLFSSINFVLIMNSLMMSDILGQMASLFVLTVAASESAMALALIMLFFRVFNEMLLEKI